MGIKQRRQGLLRRPHTITGEKTRPKSLKPKRSAKIDKKVSCVTKE